MSRRLHYSPQIHPTTFVANTATIIGDVVLAEDASVWFGAVLRGDNDAIRVGPRTNIQDQAIVHVDPDEPCAIGADVTVGHRAIIHAATIEDGCLIGMGAIVLNGAVVGAGSIVGAGAVIRAGEVIPPRSLVVGLPARVVRTLSDEQVAENLASAARYVANAHAYLTHEGKTESRQD